MVGLVKSIIFYIWRFTSITSCIWWSCFYTFIKWKNS